MSRRTALPGAAELFRATGGGPIRELAPAAAAAAPTSSQHGPGLDGPSQPRPAALVSLVAGAAPDSADRALSQVSNGVRKTAARRRPQPAGERRPSGRERHDEKITVYVSAEELMDLEHARLALRGDHGLAVDRGRMVREALAVVIADFEANADASILVRRLRGG